MLQLNIKTKAKRTPPFWGYKQSRHFPPPKNFKRKFLHSVMKYTTNGVSAFNPLILELEIFKALDVKVARTHLYACWLCF